MTESNSNCDLERLSRDGTVCHSVVLRHREPCRVGRAPQGAGCQLITIAGDPFCSLNEFELRFSDGCWVLDPCNETENGVKLNNQVVSSIAKISNADRITIGDSTVFRFVEEPASPQADCCQEDSDSDEDHHSAVFTYCPEQLDQRINPLKTVSLDVLTAHSHGKPFAIQQTSIDGLPLEPLFDLNSRLHHSVFKQEITNLADRELADLTINELIELEPGVAGAGIIGFDQKSVESVADVKWEVPLESFGSDSIDERTRDLLSYWAPLVQQTALTVGIDATVPAGSQTRSRLVISPIQFDLDSCTNILGEDSKPNRVVVGVVFAQTSHSMPDFDFDTLLLFVTRMFSTCLHQLRIQRVKQAVRVAATWAETEFVGESASIKELKSIAFKYAKSDIRILIRGEAGTGKDVLAKQIHRFSHRRDKPFIAINCAALPDALVESELFGHEKGAFTDAQRQRIGVFEQAIGGTIFLDEIGDLSSANQAKLLRVLENGTFTRVGGNEEITSDARVISATNQDIESGQFRHDLRDRINTVELFVPPLRDRVEDIPLIYEKLIRRACERYARHVPETTDDAIEVLVNWNGQEGKAWPGNVRELNNLCERLIVLLPVQADDDHQTFFATQITAREIAGQLRGMNQPSAKTILDFKSARKLADAKHILTYVAALSATGLMTQKEQAKSIGMDPGQFSKMLKESSAIIKNVVQPRGA